MEPPPPRPFSYSGLAPYEAELAARFDPSRTFTAKTPVPPLSGGTLAVSTAGKVVAADPDRSLVYLIDLTMNTHETVTLEAGDEPGRVVTRGNTAYVALRGAGEIAAIDLTTREVRKTPVCALPRGLHAGPDSLLVACASGELVTLDASDHEVQRLYVADDLRDVGVDASGIWLSRYRSAELLRVSDDGSVTSRGRPEISPERAESLGVTLSPRSPTLASRTLSSAGGGVMMLHQRSQTTPVIAERGGYGGAFDFCSSSIVQSAIAGFSPDHNLSYVALLPNAVLPVDAALSPSGAHLAIVSPGSLWQQDQSGHSNRFGEFGEVLAGTGSMRQLALMRTDAVAHEASEPNVLCASDAPQWEHRFPGEAQSVAFVSDQRFVVLLREPSELRVFDFDQEGNARLTSVIDLDRTSVLDTGHQIFHAGTALGISCASCHGEGQDDGHTWTFANIGPRRTQSLAGGLLASAPFHWDGDQSDLRALADEVLTGRMGGPLLNDPWLTALGGFIDALPTRSIPAKDPASAARGKQLFATARCNTCHSGDDYRGKGAFDVGTGGTFQVPSLLGVSQRLPIMHDGCAKTLRERFDPACGGDNHGDITGLSEGQINDLIAFLSSL